MKTSIHNPTEQRMAIYKAKKPTPKEIKTSIHHQMMGYHMEDFKCMLLKNSNMRDVGFMINCIEVKDLKQVPGMKHLFNETQTVIGIKLQNVDFWKKSMGTENYDFSPEGDLGLETKFWKTYYFRKSLSIELRIC